MTKIKKDNKLSSEIEISRIFAEDMISELIKNSHKESILEINSFEQIITELEYHKAKLFLAIRVKNYGAIREYLADSGNFLMAIGNFFGVYSDERNNDKCFEINKDAELFVEKTVAEQSKNQKLI